jgi:hypothetical protein
LFILMTIAAAVLAAATLDTSGNSARQVLVQQGRMLPYGVFLESLLLFSLSLLRRWTMRLRMCSQPGLRGRPLPIGLLMWR